MEFVINDLSLQGKSKNTYEVINNLRTLVNLLKELKKRRLLRKLITDKQIRGLELAPSYFIEQALNDVRLTNEERLFLKTFFINMEVIGQNENIIFESEYGSSFLLGQSYIRNAFVVSLETKSVFSSLFLEGRLKAFAKVMDIRLMNLSRREHVAKHEKNLGVRVYENNPKHKVNYGWGSPMDLDDETAQQVLDTAIPVPNNENHLINCYNGKYYSFRRHHHNCFHGYIDDTIPENFRVLLNKK